MSKSQMSQIFQDAKLLPPGERLRAVRNYLHHSRSYICQTYGLSMETLRAWENGKVKLTDKALARCLNIYRNEGVILSKQWVLTGEGLDPKISAELGKYFGNNLIASIEIENEILDDTLLMIKEADFFKQSSKDSIILLVGTEDMLPFYAPGDYVGGRLKPFQKIEEALGKDCIIISQSGEKFFRRVSKNATNGSYNLTCHNPLWGQTLEPVIYNVAIESVAPVIWHRRPD